MGALSNRQPTVSGPHSSARGLQAPALHGSQWREATQGLQPEPHKAWGRVKRDQDRSYIRLSRTEDLHPPGSAHTDRLHKLTFICCTEVCFGFDTK